MFRQVVAGRASREGKEEEDEEEIKQKTVVAEAVDWSGESREARRARVSRARGPRKGELAGAPCPRRLISGSPEELSQHLRRV